MFKSWHIGRKVHLGMKVYHKYQDAFHIYGTVSHSANEPSEFLARIFDQFGAGEDYKWFESLEDAKAHIESICKYKEYRQLKYADMSKYYHCKLYFYDKDFQLMDIFKNVDEFSKRYESRLGYARSIFIRSKDEIALNDNRLNFLSPSKFHERYDHVKPRRTKKRSTPSK